MNKGTRIDPQAQSWPLAGYTLSLEMSRGDVSLISLPGLCPMGLPVLGADGWSSPCPQQKQGRTQGHRLGCPYVGTGLCPQGGASPTHVPLVPSYEESSTPKEAPGASKEEPTEASKKEK